MLARRLWADVEFRLNADVVGVAFHWKQCGHCCTTEVFSIPLLWCNTTVCCLFTSCKVPPRVVL